MSSVLAYLQTLAELLSVRHEPGVFVSFIEPGAAADLSGTLLPVHSVALPLLDMYVISLSIHSYHHLISYLSYCTAKTHTVHNLQKLELDFKQRFNEDMQVYLCCATGILEEGCCIDKPCNW